MHGGHELCFLIGPCDCHTAYGFQFTSAALWKFAVLSPTSLGEVEG